jgi:hypothetical protein
MLRTYSPSAQKLCSTTSAPPTGSWLVARDATQLRALLGDHEPTIISFDHDLGRDESGVDIPSGHHCMGLMIDDALNRPTAFDYLRQLCRRALMQLAMRTCAAC